MLLERAVERKQQAFSCRPVAVAAMCLESLAGRGRDGLGTRDTVACLQSYEKSLKVTAHPHIVSEANMLQEGHWRKKTTRLEPILATRQGTLESV